MNNLQFHLYTFYILGWICYICPRTTDENSPLTNSDAFIAISINVHCPCKKNYNNMNKFFHLMVQVCIFRTHISFSFFFLHSSKLFLCKLMVEKGSLDVPLPRNIFHLHIWVRYKVSPVCSGSAPGSWISCMFPENLKMRSREVSDQNLSTSTDSFSSRLDPSSGCLRTLPYQWGYVQTTYGGNTAIWIWISFSWSLVTSPIVKALDYI